MWFSPLWAGFMRPHYLSPGNRRSATPLTSIWYGWVNLKISLKDSESEIQKRSVVLYSACSQLGRYQWHMLTLLTTMTFKRSLSATSALQWITLQWGWSGMTTPYKKPFWIDQTRMNETHQCCQFNGCSTQHFWNVLCATLSTRQQFQSKYFSQFNNFSPWVAFNY